MVVYGVVVVWWCDVCCFICGVWRVVVYGIMMVWWCHWLGVWCGGGAGGVCHIQLDSIGFDSCSKRCMGQVPPKGAPVPYPPFRLDSIWFGSIRFDSTRFASIRFASTRIGLVRSLATISDHSRPLATISDH